jgi:amino-acid N-acetyltransferase
MRIHPRPSASKVKELLAACNLPASDLQAADFEHFFGCGPESEPKGVVGVELYGKVGLLRSLAVEEAARGQGCGGRLVTEAEKYAAANGVEALYLLTTTAEQFFAALGYAKVERASLPQAIQRTSEFSTLCPSSAAAMVKRLKT